MLFARQFNKLRGLSAAAAVSIPASSFQGYLKKILAPEYPLGVVFY
jgi:hypothetical protein